MSEYGKSSSIPVSKYMVGGRVGIGYWGAWDEGGGYARAGVAIIRLGVVKAGEAGRWVGAGDTGP